MSATLPTRTELSAMTSVADLTALKARIEREIVRLETDLDFRIDRINQERWESRARRALTGLRFKLRLVEQRLKQLQVDTDPVRPRELCHPLTLEILDGVALPALRETETVATMDAMIARLDGYIDAMLADRTDEIGLAAGDRDEAFLAATKAQLKLLRTRRFEFQTRRRDLDRASRKTAHSARAETREQLFIDAAREILDRATYQAVWDRVDRMERQDATRPGVAA